VRVAVHCPYSLSVPGGVQGQVAGLARALESRGHQVTVLAPVDERARASGERDIADLGRDVGFVSLGGSVSLRANGSIAAVAPGPKASLRALRALRTGRFDVLHLHEPFAPGASYACLALARVARVGTFHRSGDTALYRVLGPLARWGAERLQVRCAVSPQARSTVAHALGGTYELVANGVDSERFERAQPWPTEGPTVFFVGRHEHRKGLALLLGAFAGIREPGAVLWVAGEGPETEALKRRFAPGDSVEWLGRIGDAEVARRLRGAHVVCFPSLGGESFGVVLLEAMSARTAIVASNLPGYRFAAGGHADLVAPGDLLALRTALRNSLSDALKGTGRSTAEALEAAAAHARCFSMTAIAARYESIYEEAVDLWRSSHNGH